MRVALLLLLSFTSFAQQSEELFDKAPPEVDEALRARVAQFYQAHVDGKFRQADELVAEDSKDIFFEAEKTRLRGFDILRIVYSDEFTKAKVVVALDRDMGALGTRFRVKAPVSSLWKIDGGKWCWYSVRSDEILTPHGTMHPGPMPDESRAITLTRGPQVAALHAMVRPDKTNLNLSGIKESSDTARVVSSLPGKVDLILVEPQIPGVKVTLDRTQIDKGEPATVTVRFTPSGDTKPPASVRFRVVVRQTNDAIWFEARFSDVIPVPAPR